MPVCLASDLARLGGLEQHLSLSVSLSFCRLRFPLVVTPIPFASVIMSSEPSSTLAVPTGPGMVDRLDLITMLLDDDLLRSFCLSQDVITMLE